MTSDLRIFADENVETATIRYLRKLGHDVERVVDELGTGASDAEVAAYSAREDRLVLTQDDDFVSELADEAAGVLFQVDETMSTKQVGDAVHAVARQADAGELDLVYVTTTWL